MEKEKAQSERVRKLVNGGFMEYHNNGHTIQEIADTFNLSCRTVYMHLQDIALKEGVSRESLLRNKSSEHNVQNKRSYEKYPALDELKSISVSLSQELEQVKTFNDSLIAMINDDEEDYEKE